LGVKACGARAVTGAPRREEEKKTPARDRGLVVLDDRADAEVLDDDDAADERGHVLACAAAGVAEEKKKKKKRRRRTALAALPGADGARLPLAAVADLDGPRREDRVRAEVPRREVLGVLARPVPGSRR